MSEELIGKLARFTPAAVDRDAMLFAAGRASVRPSRSWKWATAVLAVSQAVTLAVWLWPAAPVPVPAPQEAPTPPEPPRSYATDPNTLMALSHDPETRPTSLPIRLLADPSEPLTAFTRELKP